MSLESSKSTLKVVSKLPAKHPMLNKCVHCQRLVIKHGIENQELDFFLVGLLNMATDDCTLCSYIWESFIKHCPINDT